MERWRWVERFQFVGDGPGVHHIGAIWEFDGRAGVGEALFVGRKARVGSDI